jgi:pimeloyl-ACP methyl ester carboxylesterase
MTNPSTTLRCFLFCLFMIASRPSFGQTTPDWNAFAQSLDATPYRGSKFRFTGYVRVENGNRASRAGLWARVDKKKGTGFFDNMHKRPITENEWRQYAIEGDIDAQATRLVFGGLVFGAGKYFFDDFALQIQDAQGQWNTVPLRNAGFEDDAAPETEWKRMEKTPGFDFHLVTEGFYAGQRALVIDASSRSTDSRFVKVNGITLHYKESGAGDTLLLLHGNMESLRSFSKQIPELSKKYFVIAVDSRGQGYSSEDGTRMTYELMADDMIAFMNAKGIRRAHVLGWSDGGNIGLLMAMNHPARVQSLAVMGANLYNDKTAVDDKINKTLNAQYTHLKAQPNADRFQREMMELLLFQPNIKSDDLSRITCPTLVMAGQHDAIKEPHTRLIASSIKNAKLVIFPKGTHYEPIEKPDRFNAAVLAFLDSLPKE